MEEMQNQDAPKMSSIEENQEEQELSHTDKLVGLFTEPQNTYGKISKFPAKTVDWILPVFVMIVVIILGQFVLRTNAEIRQQQKEKGLQQIEKNFDEAVKKGQMTRDQADEQMARIEDNMEQGNAFQAIGLIVGTPIVMFIVFFVISGFFLLVTKFGLKGAGTYKYQCKRGKRHKGCVPDIEVGETDRPENPLVAGPYRQHGEGHRFRAQQKPKNEVGHLVQPGRCQAKQRDSVARVPQEVQQLQPGRHNTQRRQGAWLEMG